MLNPIAAMLPLIVLVNQKGSGIVHICLWKKICFWKNALYIPKLPVFQSSVKKIIQYWKLEFPGSRTGPLIPACFRAKARE